MSKVMMQQMSTLQLLLGLIGPTNTNTCKPVNGKTPKIMTSFSPHFCKAFMEQTIFCLESCFGKIVSFFGYLSQNREGLFQSLCNLKHMILSRENIVSGKIVNAHYLKPSFFGGKYRIGQEKFSCIKIEHSGRDLKLNYDLNSFHS